MDFVANDLGSSVAADRCGLTVESATFDKYRQLRHEE
jgi:hypothetical protein